MNKIIVCGSRGFTDYNFVKRYLDKLLMNLPRDKYHLEIVSGHCPNSPDVLAEKYAKEELGFEVNKGLKLFPANWEKYKKSGGHFRNVDMAHYGTHCVAFNAGTDGTKDMLDQARLRGLVIREIEVEIKK